MQDNVRDIESKRAPILNSVKKVSSKQQPSLHLAHSGNLLQEDATLEESRRRPFVLIVDDQSTSRKILEELARSVDSNMLIESYEDPFEALGRATARTPDLIITDYKMPVMNGVEFTKRVRALPSCADVPLMVVTIVQDRRIRYEALDAGATDFLTRPIDYHECLARCTNLLTMRRQQKIIRNRARWLEEQVALATKRVHSRERETLLRLAKAGEYRDEETGNHVLRMAKYSHFIAEALGQSELDCSAIEQAAPMHDIGKIGISDTILLKPGRHTREEFRIMQTHTTIGYEILSGSPSNYIQLGAVIALGHHEKYDGSGYPHGLSGEDIPLVARIVAVADVYDALTTVRPYKSAWLSAKAVDYITGASGKHFDPQCVNAFLAQFDAISEVRQQLRDEAIPDEDDSGNSA